MPERVDERPGDVLGVPSRIRTCAHGSGGRLCDLANLCSLPAWTRSLVPRTTRIIPRIFRIMIAQGRTLQGDGPRPVRAGYRSWGSIGGYVASHLCPTC